MKKISVVVILCLSFFFYVTSSCTKTVTKTVTVIDTVTNIVLDSNIHLTTGLIAYYPFNGNANDESGNNLNGTVNGGVTFSNDATGAANSAVTFDGSTGYIVVPDNLGKFQTNSVSISFEANMAALGNRATFVSSLNFNDGSGYVYGAGILAGGQQFNFGVESNTLGCAIPVFDLSTSIQAANTISLNKWYHVVVTFSDSLQQIYVDGILNTAVTRSFSTLNQCSNNKTLMIGGWWSGDLVSVSGSMDEVRIYNRELNQNEISKLAKMVN